MNHQKTSWILFFLIISFLFSTSAHAFPMTTPLVSQEDIIHPPEGMIAGTGKIVKIHATDDLARIPHDFFQLDIEIVTRLPKQKKTPYITIDYGPCHQLPGQVGSVINILAEKQGERWVAPQFWTHRVKKVTPSSR